MDEADRANQEIERSQAEAQRQRKPEGPRYTGRCANCDAVVTPGLRWCDAICRDDWEGLTARRG
jgi:hypothetical protein